MDANDKGVPKPTADEFGTDRTQRCVELMSPEVRALYKLPFEEKVKKSHEIIREALTRYRNLGIGFSGGADSQVMLHMALQEKPDIPILFVDTRYEFPETLKFIEELRQEWNFTSLTTVRAKEDRAEEFKAKYGFGTPEFTLEFNKYHKIEPLIQGIKNLNLDAILAGIRGVEHEERAKESIYSARHNPVHIRVHPVLFWSRDDMLEYIKRNKIRYNPLYDKGYTSLGSTLDTTRNDTNSMHERAGRGVERERIMKRLRDLGYT
jgi:phosphoadenosine phosphosulfate reductase